MAAQLCSSVSTTPSIRRRNIILVVAIPLALLVLFLIVVFTNSSGARPPAAAAILMKMSHRRQMDTRVKEWMGRRWRWWSSSIGGALNDRKRQFIGSAPPTCLFGYGGCVPCSAVHISIQPGRSSPLEYYPEAWRCKCGNRLFMP